MAKTKKIVGAVVGAVVGAAAIAASVFTLVKKDKDEDEVDALPEGELYEVEYEEVDDVEEAE